MEIHPPNPAWLVFWSFGRLFPDEPYASGHHVLLHMCALLRKGIKEVQSLLVRWYTETEVPLVVWSDNGSQFRGVVAEAVRGALNVAPRFIPPGRPQSNGLVEVQLVHA